MAIRVTFIYFFFVCSYLDNKPEVSQAAKLFCGSTNEPGALFMHSSSLGTYSPLVMFGDAMSVQRPY